MLIKTFRVISIACIALPTVALKAQISKNDLAGQQNVITTAVPFLTITPDSRRAGMGDAGVASSPDANSSFWNVASMAFMDDSKPAGFSLSYAPWLRKLVPGISYNYLTGYSKFKKRSVLAGSFRYFSLGEINFTDFNGDPIGKFNPNEFAVDGSYATQLSKHFSLGISLRFIRSNLAGTRTVNGISTKAGIAGAGDVSAYYQNKTDVGGKKANYAFGINIQNLGSKITYTDKANRDYIPMNLKMGTSWTFELDEFNKLTVMGDVNKLLVPTPRPFYLKSYNGADDSINTDGNRVIGGYKRSDDPIIAAVLKSFSDAPGGFKEELKEWNYSLGLEYWYAKQFAVRAGYFNEPATKGNRKYLTFGFGLRYRVFGLDAAYLVPFQQRHPLQDQLRFTLLFDLGAFGDQNAE